MPIVRYGKYILLFTAMVTLALSATSFAVKPDIQSGIFQKIYDPSVGESTPWYINDHALIRGPDQLWHMFGITHAEPPDPLHEIHFAHATSPTLTGAPWTKREFAMTADPTRGEVHLWAPHIVHHEGLYYMFYCAGDRDHSRYKIHLATSPDLWTWTRSEANPLFVDGFDARDPYVMKVGQEWVMYYTANLEPQGGKHIVAYRKSRDLLRWGERGVALERPESGTSGGPTESPYVVQRDGLYYLFSGPLGGYVGTAVYESEDPFHFDVGRQIGWIPSHAAEVVQDLDGSWFITHSGWRQGGLYLAPLLWP